MESKEQKIISEALKVFMKYGIKSVTMDDLAKQLNISKKTLYQYVSDKNDLLRKALFMQEQEEREFIQKICNKNLNAIDQSFEISKYVIEILKNIHPSIHFDLEKYHAEAWNEVMKKRHSFVYDCMVENIKKGIREGHYRDDLNIPIIAKIYISRIDIVFDGKIFPPDEFNFPQVYIELFKYHTRGIASEEGLNYLLEKMKKENYLS